MMGAEEYGVATTSLVAMGCIMVRQCHSNTCPVGVCTQDDDLRKRFSGTADKVVNLFSFIAEEVREIVAELGFKELNEIIGRTDLLSQISRGSSHLDDLDLNSLLIQAEKDPDVKYFNHTGINDAGSTLDEKIILDAAKFLETGQKTELNYNVKNTDRTIGSKLSSNIYNKFKDTQINDDQITLNLNGSAGQSLGAFAVRGLTIKVHGDANDYVGKSLSGGKIVIRPDKNSKIKSNENTIMGNTCMYGATSGFLYASGKAGERFAVRNSGATAVVEGCGSNGCEYMTGGNVIILGKTGDNFGAGMTGGMAFVYDSDKKLTNLNQAVKENLKTIGLKNKDVYLTGKEIGVLLGLNAEDAVKMSKKLNSAKFSSVTTHHFIVVFILIGCGLFCVGMFLSTSTVLTSICFNWGQELQLLRTRVSSNRLETFKHSLRCIVYLPFPFCWVFCTQLT